MLAGQNDADRSHSQRSRAPGRPLRFISCPGDPITMRRSPRSRPLPLGSWLVLRVMTALTPSVRQSPILCDRLARSMICFQKVIAC